MTHPTAILEGNITIADNVEIGPYAVLQGTIHLANNVHIASHACLIGKVTIDEHSSIGHHAVIGGNPQDLGFNPNTPSGVQIGKYNVLREFTTIHRSTQQNGLTRIGNHNYLMAGTHLGHDTNIGNHNILANDVLLGGFVDVGNHVFLGGGSAYHQKIRIASHCMVQGHSSISKDIPPYVIAHAFNQLSGLNSIGLRRSNINPDSRASLKRAYHLVVRQGASLKTIQTALTNETWSTEAKHFLEFYLTTSNKGICR